MAVLYRDEEVRLGKSTAQKITEYKNIVIERLLSNQRLLKLVCYDRPDCLRQADIQEPDELVYDRIYPYRFVPEPTESQRTYITIGMNNFRRIEDGFGYSERYVSCNLTFYVFTQTDLMKTNYGVRQDLIIAELEELVMGKTGLGIGKAKIRGLNEIWFHNNKFGGYAYSVELVDLK